MSKFLAQAVQELSEEYKNFKTVNKNTLQHAVNCGRILLQIKEHCEHGKWQAWLDFNMEFGNLPLANNRYKVYMRLAKNSHLIVGATCIREALNVIRCEKEPIVNLLTRLEPNEVKSMNYGQRSEVLQQELMKVQQQLDGLLQEQQEKYARKRADQIDVLIRTIKGYQKILNWYVFKQEQLKAEQVLLESVTVSLMNLNNYFQLNPRWDENADSNNYQVWINLIGLLQKSTTLTRKFIV